MSVFRRKGGGGGGGGYTPVRLRVCLVGTVQNRIEQLVHMEQPHASRTVLQKQSTFLGECAKLGAFLKMCTGHHGHFVRCDESNPNAYARDQLGPKPMFPPGFTVNSETARSAPASRPEQAGHVLADQEQVQSQPNVLVNPILGCTNQTRPFTPENTVTCNVRTQVLAALPKQSISPRHSQRTGFIVS